MTEDVDLLSIRAEEFAKVSANLQAKNVGDDVLETWAKIESQDFLFEDEDEDLIF